MRAPELDGHAGAKDHVRFDHRVASDHGIMRELDGIGRHQRHAIRQRHGPRAGLKRGLGIGKLGAGVDAQRFGLVAAHHGGAQATGAGQIDDIGQVVFPGGIVVAQSGHQLHQHRCLGGHHAGIAQGDGALGIGRVLELDDSRQLIALDQKPPVAGRIRWPRSPEPRCHGWRAPRPGFQRFGRDKRRIAVKHHRIARKIRQHRRGLQHGMAGAQLLGLLHDPQLGVPVAGHAGNIVAAMPRYHDDALRRQRSTACQRMHQQRHPAQRVQDLGQVRVHARALPRREDDQCRAHEVT